MQVHDLNKTHLCVCGSADLGVTVVERRGHSTGIHISARLNDEEKKEGEKKERNCWSKLIHKYECDMENEKLGSCRSSIYKTKQK